MATEGAERSTGADQRPVGVAYVNGGYRSMGEAKISVTDLGVTRSDATYDVVHVWDGRFFRLTDHIERFMNNVEALRLNPELTAAGLTEILNRCVARSGLRAAYVSMTCTRGVLPPGSRDLRLASPSFYCYVVPFVWIVDPVAQEQGSSMWIADVPRIDTRSVPSAVKNYHWLDLDRAQLAAYDHGADLVVLSDETGQVSEGPGYNVFALVDGVWKTPVDNVLPGITRATALELLRRSGQAALESSLEADELRGASEVFVTSTAGGIMPITRIGDGLVGSGLPGPVTMAMRSAYWELHADSAWTTPVDYERD
jgi:branched-chain amino acid aminotransferase